MLAASPEAKVLLMDTVAEKKFLRKSEVKEKISGLIALAYFHF